jgi:hypothetical protein
MTIRATIKTFAIDPRLAFPEMADEVDVLARNAVQAGIEEGAAVAQASASIDLKLERVEAHPDPTVEGYSGGIRSRATSSVKGSTTPIATFFDKGTLGNRRGRLKRGRKGAWTQRNPDSSETHVAHRGDVEGKGIPAERFFTKAKAAGRAKMLEQVKRDLT